MISCCLIGEDSLLIKYGDMLLSRNLRIECVMCPTKTTFLGIKS